MATSRTAADFEQIFLPHLDSAYSLARMLLRRTSDAEDVVQESYLRALRSFSTFRGDAARPWLLTIVRNTAYTWLRKNQTREPAEEFRDEAHPGDGPDPEVLWLRSERKRGIENCIDRLPEDFREAIVLREVEELPYREIAEITGVPAGTVMSRLSRARARLAECLKLSGGVR